MAADARIRFMIELDAAGQVKAVNAVKGVGDEAERQGQRFGKGVEGSFARMMDHWGKFVAGGVVLQRVWHGIAETMKNASAYAKQRVSDWDSKNGAFRSDQFRRMTGSASMRVLGVTNQGVIDTVSNQLEFMRTNGRGEAAGDFNMIARTLTRRGMTGSDLEQAMLSAVSGLYRRGHLPGFGEAYNTLAGAKGVAKGANLTDLATGLIMRSNRMPEDQAKALAEGLGSGDLRVGKDGMLSAATEAMRSVADLVNKMGGLSVGAWTKPRELNGLDPQLGYAYSERAAQDGGLDWKDPRTIAEHGGGDRPKDETTVADYIKAAFDSVVVQAAIGAAFMKGVDMMLAARAAKAAADAAKEIAGRAAAGASGSAAGGAAGGAAGAATRSALVTVATRASLATVIATISGDSLHKERSEDGVDAAARAAWGNSDLRQAYINRSARDDEDAIRILERMHQIALEQSKIQQEQLQIMRKSGGSAQVGE